MSESKVYEGVFQWPTKGEVVSGIFTGVLTLLFWLLAFVDPSVVPVSVILTLSTLLMFFLGRKVRRSAFANVYKDRVEIGSSFFRVKMARIEASKIESVTFGQSVLGKSNYGNISIGGSGGMKLRVANLRDPEAFVAAVNAISSAPVNKNSAVTSTSSAQEISELNSLLKSGVITQDEFEKGKKRALGS